jgi:peroxiredoxin
MAKLGALMLMATLPPGALAAGVASPVTIEVRLSPGVLAPAAGPGRPGFSSGRMTVARQLEQQTFYFGLCPEMPMAGAVSPASWLRATAEEVDLVDRVMAAPFVVIHVRPLPVAGEAVDLDVSLFSVTGLELERGDEPAKQWRERAQLRPGQEVWLAARPEGQRVGLVHTGTAPGGAVGPSPEPGATGAATDGTSGAAAGATGLSGRPAAVDWPRKGDPAPAWVAFDLVGGAVDLASLLGKTPILITFWATWCGPCKEELAELGAMQPRFAGAVRFFAVSIDHDVAALRDYVRGHPLPFPVLHDADGTARRLYGADRLPVPRTVLIGGDGRVVRSSVGYGTGASDGFRAELERLTGRGAGAKPEGAPGR